MVRYAKRLVSYHKVRTGITQHLRELYGILKSNNNMKCFLQEIKFWIRKIKINSSLPKT